MAILLSIIRNMKNIKKCLMLAVVVAMVIPVALVFSGCGGGKKDTQGLLYSETILGAWGSCCIKSSFVFLSDGTVYKGDGETDQEIWGTWGTWSIKGNQLTMIFENGTQDETTLAFAISFGDCKNILFLTEEYESVRYLSYLTRVYSNENCVSC